MATVDRIEIRHPCSASWAAMEGDDRARFCNLCSTTVYNASELTTCELERMLAKPKPPCLRVTRDSSGRVLTRDRIAALAFVGLTACMGAPAESAQTIPEVGSRGSPTELVAGAEHLRSSPGGADGIPELGGAPTGAPLRPTRSVAVPTLGEPVMGDVVVAPVEAERPRMGKPTIHPHD